MSDPTSAPEPATPETAAAQPPVPPPVYPAPSAAAPPSAAIPAAPQNGLGTAALVMGILQFLCLPIVASILAIVFGWLGMTKAKQGQATNGGVAKAGFILGIIGLVLSIVGIVVTIALVAFGVNAASNAIDQANNERTGLADGNYAMEPNTSLRLNDRCSFGGVPYDVTTNQAGPASVTVVGQGPVQCAGSGTPDAVYFTVSGGVAEIVAVQ